MKSLIVVLSIVFSSSAFALTEPSRTYFLEVSGNEEIKTKLIHELTEKECFTLNDIGEKSNSDECHAFRQFENQSQTIGTTDPGFLYKIRIASTDKFNLQIFEKDGKKLRRIVNAGDFTPKRNFFSELKLTTIKLTFK